MNARSSLFLLLFPAILLSAGDLGAMPAEQESVSPRAEPRARAAESDRLDRLLERQEELERRIDRVLENQKRILEELDRIRMRSH